MNLGHLQEARVKWLSQGAWFTLGQPKAHDLNQQKKRSYVDQILFEKPKWENHQHRQVPKNLEQVSHVVKVELEGLRRAEATEANAVRKQKL